MEMTWEEMKNVNIQEVDPDTLVDINDIVINPDLPQEERMKEFVKQIKNPYCFKCGKTVVKLKFAENGDTIEERLERYLSSL